jgi:hypothetical protein
MWLAFDLLCHAIKFHKTKGVRKERATTEALEDERDKLEKGEECPKEVHGSGETSSRPESDEEEAHVSASALIFLLAKIGSQRVISLERP